MLKVILEQNSYLISGELTEVEEELIEERKFNDSLSQQVAMLAGK